MAELLITPLFGRYCVVRSARPLTKGTLSMVGVSGGRLAVAFNRQGVIERGRPSLAMTGRAGVREVEQPPSEGAVRA